MNNEYLKIKSKVKYVLFCLIYFLLFPIAKIIYGRRKNWLVCERGNDAQDNGFLFFKYLIEKHRDLCPVFLIKKDSPDYQKVSKIGKVVEFGSFKHFVMAIGFPIKISSHLFGYAPWIQLSLYYRRNKTKDIHVFLQHGVIKNLHEGLFKDVCKSLDLFVCGAKPEFDFIFRDFHYENDVPQYTGLARYDYLINCQTNHQIILMPTWRASLSGVGDDVFMKSNFYKNWDSLINNERLINACKSKGLIIKYYLHYSFQKYSRLFKSNDCVKVINFGEEVVQNLLKESKLLVTDFSSVYFDFGFMRKPVIYFQFDESTFNDEHYTKGYFDYRRDGFGDVCLNVEETIDSIIKVINNNFEVEDKYLRRMDTNFIYRDNKNCERIFNRICMLGGKK